MNTERAIGRACCSSTTIRMRAKCTPNTSSSPASRSSKQATAWRRCNGPSTNMPDIILMDLSLPVMDGWEATRRLKADKRTASIPVVALTGHALAGISEGARKAGCDAFVTKPCLPEDLVSEIRKILDGQSSTTTKKGPQERQTCQDIRLARARALAPRDRLVRWRRSNVERKARRRRPRRRHPPATVPSDRDRSCR